MEEGGRVDCLEEGGGGESTAWVLGWRLGPLRVGFPCRASKCNTEIDTVSLLDLAHTGT